MCIRDRLLIVGHPELRAARLTNKLAIEVDGQRIEETDSEKLLGPDGCVTRQGCEYCVTGLGQEYCATDVLSDALRTGGLGHHLDHPPGRWFGVVQLPEHT